MIFTNPKLSDYSLIIPRLNFGNSSAQACLVEAVSVVENDMIHRSANLGFIRFS
jgi:hypothetical protein